MEPPLGDPRRGVFPRLRFEDKIFRIFLEELAFHMHRRTDRTLFIEGKISAARNVFVRAFIEERLIKRPALPGDGLNGKSSIRFDFRSSRKMVNYLRIKKKSAAKRKAYVAQRFCGRPEN